MSEPTRRGRAALIRDTLKACKKHSKPTKIMYEAGLGWNSLKDILGHLIRSGYVEHKPEERDRRGRDRYYLTAEGERTLRTLTTALEKL